VSLRFRDLSPYQGDLTAEDDAWLAEVAAIDPRDYRIGIDDERAEEEWLPLIERGRDGDWWAGRFIGAITVKGRRLVIEPRLGIDVVEAWLDQAFGLVAPPASAHHSESETFILRLLARLWCRSIDNATRHGLPLLRLPRTHEGLYVRGRLDVKRTIELIGAGRQSVASTTHDRSLAHPVTRAIVCAERALSESFTASAEWRTERVRQVMPHLRAAVGSRPGLPTLHEISRVRYTPITLPFKQAALLSHRVASRLGYSATDEEGKAEGILVDVAELWELFVLNCVRAALPPGLRVEHGTRVDRRDFLLRSDVSNAQMGRLKPDVLIVQGDEPVAVIDAKYKRLVDSRERPRGVDQADLYQLLAYAMRFQPSAFAALAYPLDPTSSGAVSSAEALGPWLSDDQRFLFRRLPVEAADCRAQLRTWLTEMKSASGATTLAVGR
jgi:5-methylcytosine-specific restriction enzyme subunit McrC